MQSLHLIGPIVVLEMCLEVDIRSYGVMPPVEVDVRSSMAVAVCYDQNCDLGGSLEEKRRKMLGAADAAKD